METNQKVYKEIREKILDEISHNNELFDQELLDNIDHILDQKSIEYGIGLKEKLDLKNRLFNSFRKLDVLQELLDDPSITEIMINGIDEIFIEKSNRIQRWEVDFESEERLEDIIQQILEYQLVI